jgi:hypothetical protein
MNYIGRIKGNKLYSGLEKRLILRCIFYKLKVFTIMVESNEVRKVTHGPYRIAGIIHILLKQSNQLGKNKKCDGYAP